MIILDVRTLEEFTGGHIIGARNHDIMDMMQGTFPNIPKDANCIVYCESGNRSMMACTLLTQAGFSKVIDGGGVSDMVVKGYSLE